MPAEISWIIPYRVLQIYAYGEVNAVGVQNVAVDLQTYLKAGRYPVHIILNDAEAHSPPPRVADFKDAFRLAQLDLEKVGWVVGVGEAVLAARMVLPMLTALLRKNYRRVGNVEDAMLLLRQVDVTLSADAAS